MIGELANLVTNVIFIIFLTTAVDLLLPQSSVKGFVKLIMGLFVIITIIEPVGRVLALEPLSGWVLPGGGAETRESIMAQSDRYQTYVDEQMVLAYEDKLAMQMKGLITLVGEVDACQVRVSVKPMDKPGSLGEVEQVMLWLSTSQAGAQSQVSGKVESLLLQFYNLREDQLEIRWIEGEDANEAGEGVS